VWGNNEEQCYFDTEEVLQVVGDPDDASDGILAIRALNENKIVSCSNSQVRPRLQPWRAVLKRSRRPRHVPPFSAVPLSSRQGMLLTGGQSSWATCR
jgi:hypothetical protein